MPRALPPLALLAALALALTGCASASKGIAPEPTAVAAPFASEEEALAAAFAVYERLVALRDDIARSGGEGAGRLAAVSTGELLTDAVESFGRYPARGVRQIGFTVVYAPKLEQVSSGPSGAVSIYLCEDVSQVDIVDANNVSVVQPDRPDIYYFLLKFDIGRDGRLLASGREWTGETC